MQRRIGGAPCQQATCSQNKMKRTFYKKFRITWKTRRAYRGRLMPSPRDHVYTVRVLDVLRTPVRPVGLTGSMIIIIIIIISVTP